VDDCAAEFLDELLDEAADEVRASRSMVCASMIVVYRWLVDVDAPSVTVTVTWAAEAVTVTTFGLFVIVTVANPVLTASLTGARINVDIGSMWI